MAKKLILTEEVERHLLQIMDAGVRQLGLQAAPAATEITSLLSTAEQVEDPSPKVVDMEAQDVGNN